MVCAKCEKKLTKVAASDPYRNRDSQGFLTSTSARSVASSSSSSSPATSGQVSRPLSTNKLIASKSRYNPLSVKCKVCKSTVSQEKATYCSGCAYKKGLCAICGKPVGDISKFKMSSV